jgi:hypothetical protein
MTSATHAVDMELLIVFALFVALGPLSMRFGYDSRELYISEERRAL